MKQKYRYTVREIAIRDLIYSMCNTSNLRSIDHMQESLAMLQEKVEVKWCPKIGDYYYCVSYLGNVYREKFGDSLSHHWNVKIGNCFPHTEEGEKQCEEYKQKLISLGDTK